MIGILTNKKGLIIGALQGVLFYLWHKYGTQELTTLAATFLTLSVPLLISLLPLTVMLLSGSIRYVFKSVLVIAAVLSITTFYMAYSYNENYMYSFIYFGDMYFAFLIAIPFLQTYSETGKFTSYSHLYDHSWNNIILLLQSFIFTMIFWGILWLCAALFNIIKIGFFNELFSKAWFMYIITPIIFNGILSFLQTNSKTIKIIHHHLLNILTWLLPLISIITVMFAIALIFQGLESLWATKFATFMICVSQLTVILLVNASYKDGLSQTKFNQWITYLINLSIVFLPIYSIIAAYSLGLRVDEYGWSVKRVWAAMIVAQIAVYSFGYMFMTLKSGFNAIAKLDKVNISAAILMLFFFISVNSPILDPRVITIHNQVKRLKTGVITTEQFDTKYISGLGKLGKEKVQSLRDEGYKLSSPANYSPSLSRSQTLGIGECSIACYTEKDGQYIVVGSYLNKGSYEGRVCRPDNFTGDISPKDSIYSKKCASLPACKTDICWAGGDTGK